MPYILFAGFQGRWIVVAWFALAQVIVNVYPILHLRPHPWTPGPDPPPRQPQAARRLPAHGKELMAKP